MNEEPANTRLFKCNQCKNLKVSPKNVTMEGCACSCCKGLMIEIESPIKKELNVSKSGACIELRFWEQEGKIWTYDAIPFVCLEQLRGYVTCSNPPALALLNGWRDYLKEIKIKPKDLIYMLACEGMKMQTCHGGRNTEDAGKWKD